MSDSTTADLLADVPAGQRADPTRILTFCRRQWSDQLIPLIEHFIRVPAKSPAFDPQWEKRGLLDLVASEAADWLRRQAIPDLHVEVLRAPGRTPLLFFDAPAHGAEHLETVLFYGHLDKQPELDGWREGLGPWIPHFDGTRLYGRGAADDGYAVYAAGTALLALQNQSANRPRCIGVFETGEESGSPDLPHWLDVLGPRLGQIGLVVCLDSGAGDYDRLWTVTSLRGHCGGRLDVRVLDEGAHSGDAGGIVPSSFRILRQILDRLEDSTSGELLPRALHCPIPADRAEQTRDTAAILGNRVWERFAWHVGDGPDPVRPATSDAVEALLTRAWRPSLEITGADGLPATSAAGNVLRPHTTLKLSLRLPPHVNSGEALAAVTELLETAPPYGACITFTPDPVLVDGWSAPTLNPPLAEVINAASRACYNGKNAANIGQGGTIPLMGLLGRKFPTAQFLACGVLGPGVNAHGPNESLHVPYAERLTAALALVIHNMPEMSH